MSTVVSIVSSLGGGGSGPQMMQLGEATHVESVQGGEARGEDVELVAGGEQSAAVVEERPPVGVHGGAVRQHLGEGEREDGARARRCDGRMGSRKDGMVV